MKKIKLFHNFAQRCTLGLLLLGCWCIAFSLVSCDNRNIHQVVKEMASAPVDTVGWPARTLRTNPFFAVDVDCFADVTYHQTTMADDHYVEVKAPTNVLENIGVVVEDGELRINVDRRYRMAEKDVVVVNIYAPFVNRFMLIGGKCLRLGQISMTSPLEMLVDGNVATMMADSISAHEISLMLDGSGSIDLKGMQTGDVRVKLKGNGSILLAGQCERNKMTLLGDGTIDIRSLRCDSVVQEEVVGKGMVLR